MSIDENKHAEGGIALEEIAKPKKKMAGHLMVTYLLLVEGEAESEAAFKDILTDHYYLIYNKEYEAKAAHPAIAHIRELKAMHRIDVTSLEGLGKLR